MIIGTLKKDASATSRAEWTYLDYLDQAETVVSVSAPVVVSALPGDATPVTVTTPVLVSGSTGVQMLVLGGTAGIAYLVSMTVTFSSSGRIDYPQFRVHIAPAQIAS